MWYFERSSCYGYPFDLSGRRGHRLAVFAEGSDVQWDGLTDQREDFVPGLGRGYTTGQIKYICAEPSPVFGRFDYNYIFLHRRRSSFVNPACSGILLTVA
jgi:hypothetical protein